MRIRVYATLRDLMEGAIHDMPVPPGAKVGSVLERSGRPAEAAAAYRAYARLAPNAPDAREIAARAAQLDASGGKP